MGHDTSAEARPAAAFEAPRAATAVPAAAAVPAATDPAAPVRRSSAGREPAWLRIQREAAEPAPDRSLEVPDAPLADDSAEAPAPQAAASPAAAQPAPATQAATSPAAAQPAAQEPATPWPPLGASWPTRQKPGAPWPAPDATPVPAVVAAQQAPAPTMAEMWLQSAQEVLNRGSVRVCHHCALPVSTKARFCRRCGTQQV
jgi:ribosomal protein L40E